MASISARGYGAAWRKLRASILLRDPVCRVCHAARSTHVDHRIPRRQGGTDDPSNLVGVCASDHNRKTARQDGGWGNPIGAGRETRQQQRDRQFLVKLGLTDGQLADLARQDVKFLVATSCAGRVGRFYHKVRIVIEAVRLAPRGRQGRRVALWPGRGAVRRTTLEVGSWVKEHICYPPGWHSVPKAGREKIMQTAQRIADRLNRLVGAAYLQHVAADPLR